MKKVILIGLGAVGTTYAKKLKDKCDFNVLVDVERLNKYKNKRFFFNGEELFFNFVTPEQKFDADIIIIATKSQGLKSALFCINNFVSKKTRIISLINGISSEKIISESYPKAKVLKSFFIGHSAVRDGNNIIQDGIGEIVIEHDDFMEDFFKETKINYTIPDDINYSMWLKYTFNLFSNQISAILNMNFGQLKRSKSFIHLAKKIISEVKQIAEVEGIDNLQNLETDSLSFLDKMCNEGKTSMLQDILSGRPTESDIFAGEIINLGKKYNIPTPYNQLMYDLIKIKEEDNEYSIHTR